MALDAAAGDNESHGGVNPQSDREDEGAPTTPGLTPTGFNLDVSTRDLTHQGIPANDNSLNRTRATEPTTTDHRQERVQFTPVNNYYKNVSENKDVAKLVAILATCINATKKVNLKTSRDDYSCFGSVGCHDSIGRIYSI